MKSIYTEALRILASGQPFVLATVIHTWGSAPRKAGSHMLIAADKILGSVSGGCVEPDVCRRATEVLGGSGGLYLHYGISDADAWNVGLSCGGKLDLFLEAFHPEKQEDISFWETLAEAIESDLGAVVIREIQDGATLRYAVLPQTEGETGIRALAQKAFAQRAHLTLDEEGKTWFAEVIKPKQQLLIFGATHLAAEIVALAKQFDFETTVIDPRSFFTDKTEFLTAPDHLEIAWPAELLQSRHLTPFTYAVVVSHDPKIDDQALEMLLRSPVAYIGALGGKKSNQGRRDRLMAEGYTSEEIDRIHAPVGLDIRAQSAREIALSIIAELIAVQNQYV